MMDLDSESLAHEVAALEAGLTQTVTEALEQISDLHIELVLRKTGKFQVTRDMAEAGAQQIAALGIAGLEEAKALAESVYRAMVRERFAR